MAKLNEICNKLLDLVFLRAILMRARHQVRMAILLRVIEHRSTVMGFFVFTRAQKI